jgi:hypothetical protein
MGYSASRCAGATRIRQETCTSSNLHSVKEEGAWPTLWGRQSLAVIAAPLTCRSQRFKRLGPKDDLILFEKPFEFTSIVAPPRTIDKVCHNLDHNDVVPLHLIAAVPKTLSRGAAIDRQPAKGLGERCPNLVVVTVWKALSGVVVKWEKDL